MDKNEFEKWVDYVTERYPMPRVLFKKGLDDWKARMMLARILTQSQIGKLEPACDLLYSIVDIEVVEPNDIENKAWALQDLAKCISILEKDASKALKYIDMSIQLAESIQDDFSLVERGKLWYDRWGLLTQINQIDKAIIEANRKIAERDSELRNNSYLYYAYRFKAELAHDQGDIDQALEFLHKAMMYFPDEHDNMGKLEELWMNRNNDKQKTYEEMEGLTHYTHLFWKI